MTAAGPLVVVGDTLLDLDVTGVVTRSSPAAASAPVVDVEGMRRRPGGAGLAALLAAADGVPVRLATALCDDDEGRWLAAVLGERVELVTGRAEGASCLKIRVLDRGRPLVRLDHGQGIAGPSTTDMVDALAGAGAVLVADYGRGVADDPALRAALSQVAHEVPVVWDPHPRGGPPVPGCAAVTPNLAEARRALHPTALADGPQPGGLDAARLLSTRWAARSVAVTLGAHGAVLALRGEEGKVLSAIPAPRASDSCGAGDCFASALASVLRDGAGALTATTTAVRRASAFVTDGGAGAIHVHRTSPRDKEET